MHDGNPKNRFDNEHFKQIYQVPVPNQGLRDKDRTRIKIVINIAIIISLLIFIRLAYINTLSSNFLQNQLNTRVMRTIKLVAMRGTIVDRNQNPLAVSTPMASIWIDPSIIDNITSTQITKIATILAMPQSEVELKFADKQKTFVYLKRAVSPQQAEQIKNLNIDGIFSIQEYKRFYPSGEVDAHIIGFNNIDDKGAEGIEYANNAELIGKDGSKQIMRDLKGQVIDLVGSIESAEDGKQLNLSIDNRIQYIAYSALKTDVNKFKAVGGSVVVLSAKTGEVLAMVNIPTYNPNNRQGVTPDKLKNRAAVNVYDPGSTIKPLVIAKALNDKLVTPRTVFDTHPYYVGPKLIKDDHSYPSMSVTEIITHSSDIGTSKISLKYKPFDMWSYYISLGFGNKLGTGFPGETKGILLNWKKWHPIEQALMAYGYGISVSLLQMAHSYTMFTNNGCLLPITFYKVTNRAEEICKQVISPDTALTMRKILAQTTEDGTGKNAQLTSYTAAGKTGTAQKLDGATYSHTKHVGSFIGFSPANDPEIIVAVMIDEPTVGGYYGAAVAAPVFAQIAEPTLHLLGIKPDKY